MQIHLCCLLIFHSQNSLFTFITLAIVCVYACGAASFRGCQKRVKERGRVRICLQQQFLPSLLPPWQLSLCICSASTGVSVFTRFLPFTFLCLYVFFLFSSTGRPFIQRQPETHSSTNSIPSLAFILIFFWSPNLPMRTIPATSHDSDRYFYVTIPHILRLVGWRRACFSWPIWTSLGQSLACKDRFFLRIDFTSNILMPIYHFNLYYLVPSLKSAKWCTVIFTARKMEKLV